MARSKFLVAALAAASLWTGGASASVLDNVKQRGILNCGTDNTAPGFGYLNTRTGKIEGLDADFCRARPQARIYPSTSRCIDRSEARQRASRDSRR